MSNTDGFHTYRRHVAFTLQMFGWLPESAADMINDDYRAMVAVGYEDGIKASRLAGAIDRAEDAR